MRGGRFELRACDRAPSERANGLAHVQRGPRGTFPFLAGVTADSGLGVPRSRRLRESAPGGPGWGEAACGHDEAALRSGKALPVDVAWLTVAAMHPGSPYPSSPCPSSSYPSSSYPKSPCPTRVASRRVQFVKSLFAIQSFFAIEQ
ncbi:unnamed protein product [Lampetra planeri]